MHHGPTETFRACDGHQFSMGQLSIGRHSRFLTCRFQNLYMAASSEGKVILLYCICKLLEILLTRLRSARRCATNKNRHPSIFPTMSLHESQIMLNLKCVHSPSTASQDDGKQHECDKTIDHSQSSSCSYSQALILVPSRCVLDIPTLRNYQSKSSS